MKKKIIISGGGTGGHVYPAIAIANALKEIEPDLEILFVGAKGKMEMEKVPQAGYKIEGLWISGFQRKITLRNLMFPLKLLASLYRSGSIIRKFKPDVVVGVGGYASGPLLEVAARKKIPCLIQEQNSYPGMTNKLLAKKVRKICVAYAGMERFFPKEKILFTGNPVRKDFLNLDSKRDEAFSHFGFDPSKKTIFLTGGSLGARTLNHSIAAKLEMIKDSDVQLFWQAGKIYIDQFKELAEGIPNVKITAFVDRMDLAYAMADLVVCRAGASTISELTLAGKAAILVPSPNVAEDHQTANAMALVKENAAFYIKDVEAMETLVPTALDLVKQEEKLMTVRTNVKKLAKPDADNEIAREVLKLIET